MIYSIARNQSHVKEKSELNKIHNAVIATLFLSKLDAMKAPFVGFINRRPVPHVYKGLSLAALCQKPTLFPNQCAVLLRSTKLISINIQVLR